MAVRLTEGVGDPVAATLTGIEIILCLSSVDQSKFRSATTNMRY